ncbi:MAG TPA: TIGR04282 family arsenosugar biosynthesis glycosyltransferase [Pyrinomonadaceae bacterium]
MCKAPAAGTVKTRLAPFLAAEEAAGLAGCFAVDAVKKARNICESTIVAFAGEKELLETILPRNLIWVRQTGTDLGERMHNALRFAFKQIFSPLVVVGTDSPTLPMEFIKNAIEILSGDRADAVLGKTEDGGYYLIGLNQPDWRIFKNVRWSSPETFSQTAQNIKDLNLRLATLPVWYDVDMPEDLRRLKTEIENSARAQVLAPATVSWLERHNQIF